MAVAAAAGGLAAVGIISTVMGNKEAAKAQQAQIRANRLSAKYTFSSTEDSVNIMKAVNREQTTNAVIEVQRAGAAQSKDVQQQVTKVISTSIASSEGLTSGRSKGREMISLQIKGQEAVQASQNETTSAINQLVDQQDKVTNDLNNKLLAAHQDMAAVLSNTGPAITGNTQRVISSGIGGASTGASLGASFGA